MGSKLSLGNKHIGYIKTDEFFKSLMFQHIMDEELNRNERDVLLVIFRKTLHFEKITDHISMHYLSKSAGISMNTLRTTLKSLEAKELVKIDLSTGGKSKSVKKYNSFAIAGKLLGIVFKKWREIKEDNNIPFDYSAYD